MSQPPPPTTTTLTVGLLIVSTTAARDASADAAGPLLSRFFAETDAGKAAWSVVEREIVPDELGAIQACVRRWADEGNLNLIVTTGGTGFAVDDGTPEAVKPLLQKEAPGLVHAMLAASLTVTPFAMMSRPVAGVRNGSVIITVPGSPKGAKENLEAVIKLLPHACIQASGSTSSRALHSGGTKALESAHGVSSSPTHTHSHTHSHEPEDGTQGGHHHHHHHDHDHDHGHGHKAPRPHTTPEARANKLHSAVTQRHRSSPYPLLSVADATAIVARETPTGGIIAHPVNADLIGHVLAEDIVAAEAVPAYRASIVDGYAVHHSDGAGVYPVVSVSHAAPGTSPPLQPGQIARVTTGAPLPAGATAVVMVEDTVLRSMTADGSEEATVEVLAADMKDSENVREVGSDVRKGAVVLRAGTVVSGSGGEIGLLASVGVAHARVFRKPVVGVLSTGDEVVPHDRPGELARGEIRDSNRPTLLAAARAWGFRAVDLGIARDAPGALEDTLRRALGGGGVGGGDEGVDVVVSTGGVSMGELDLLKPTIEQALGGRIHFGRVSMKPGKPTTFATVSSAALSSSSASASAPATSSTAASTIAASTTTTADTTSTPTPADAAPQPKSEGPQKLLFALPGNPASALVTFHLFVLPSLRKFCGHPRSTCDLPRVPLTLAHDFPLDPARAEFHRVVVSAGADGRLLATSTGGQRSSRIASAAGGANGLLCLPPRTGVGEKRARLGVLPKGEAAEGIMWGLVAGGGG